MSHTTRAPRGIRGVLLAIFLFTILCAFLLVFRGCLVAPADDGDRTNETSLDVTRFEAEVGENAVTAGGEYEPAREDGGELPPLASLSSERLHGVVTVPEACDLWGGSPEFAANGVGTRALWRVDLPLIEAASSILEGYRDMEGVALEQDGYLDLLGHVWSCVVSSNEGWSEVVLVDERSEVDDFAAEGEEADVCTVTVVRIGSEQGV